MFCADFTALYIKLPIPIVVFALQGQEVLFLNLQARLCFGQKRGPLGNLSDILHCKRPSDVEWLVQNLRTGGFVKDYETEIKTGDNRYNAASINANVVDTEDEGLVGVLYLQLDKTRAIATGLSQADAQAQDILSQALYVSYHTSDIDDTIENILAMVGTHVGVSRVYIFENTPRKTSSNTYEWCAPGVSPQKDDMQDIPQDIFDKRDVTHYDSSFIVDDVSALPPEDRKILDSQGVRSIAIFPLFTLNHTPFGFVGFDECEKQRNWPPEEIQLLQNIAGILSSLIVRKRAEEHDERVQAILRAVLDNVESPIYVSDFKTYEILFANRGMRERTLNEDLEGKICWQVVQKGQTGPCPFCPKPMILDEQGNPTGTYHWELQNPTNGRWFYATDLAIKWVDGRYAHLESCVDITDRKKNETKLQLYASTDMMTGIYNREWGYRFLDKELTKLRESRGIATLCFLDLDGLKNVNDTFGHGEGDTMIISFVEAVKSYSRETDIFCRWGGDEFLLLLSACNQENALKVLDKITYHLDSINATGVHPYQISFSHGLEEINEFMDTPLDALISQADEKMYDNKMRRKRGLASTLETDSEKKVLPLRPTTKKSKGKQATES